MLTWWFMDMVSNPEGAPPVCNYTMYLFKVNFKCIINNKAHIGTHGRVYLFHHWLNFTDAPGNAVIIR